MKILSEKKMYLVFYYYLLLLLLPYKCCFIIEDYRNTAKRMRETMNHWQLRRVSWPSG